MFNIEEIKDFINLHEDAKIYLGCDSQRGKKKKIKFALVVIVHYNGNRGAKVFHELSFEKVQDTKLSRPFNRMMKEVMMVTELYTKLEDVLIDRDFEIHLDVNPLEGTGSNVAYQAAKGMVWGIVGVEPVCKPDGFAASCCADKFSK